MALNAQQDIDIYRSFAIAFGAAPGKTFYQAVENAYNSGLDTRTLVNLFATTSVFLERYPNTLSDAEFARRLLDNVAGNTISDAIRTGTTQVIVDAMAGGMTRGDVIYAVFNYLGNTSFQDPVWGKAAQKLANEVAISRFITTILGETSTDVRILQGYLNGVTYDTVLADRYLEIMTQYRSAQGESFTIYGNANDSITGTVADDHIDGGLGHDTINGGDGNDILYGNAGDDRIYGGWGGDYLDGGLGADYLDGGWLKIYSWTAGYVYDLSTNIIFGGGGSDTIKGGYGNDQLHGGDGADLVYGYEGKDMITGGAGDDELYGGNVLDNEGGGDTIDGGTGNDYISSGVDSLVYGGDGADRIRVGLGSTVYGGGGNDFIHVGYDYDSTQVTRVLPGDNADSVSVYSAHRAAAGVYIDLAEAAPSSDSISVETQQSLQPTVYIAGFQFGQDEFALGGFYTTNGSWTHRAGYYDSWYKQWVSYTQLVTSPTQPFVSSAGFFVIQGAAATASDTISVAAFLDAYGNNHTYANSRSHYFLINVGSNDIGLYLFKDDTGADNQVVPDEIIPVAVFTNVRTDQLSLTDILYSFV